MSPNLKYEGSGRRSTCRNSNYLYSMIFLNIFPNVRFSLGHKALDEQPSLVVKLSVYIKS